MRLGNDTGRFLCNLKSRSGRNKVQSPTNQGWRKITRREIIDLKINVKKNNPEHIEKSLWKR